MVATIEQSPGSSPAHILLGGFSTFSRPPAPITGVRPHDHPVKPHATATPHEQFTHQVAATLAAGRREVGVDNPLPVAEKTGAAINRTKDENMLFHSRLERVERKVNPRQSPKQIEALTLEFAKEQASFRRFPVKQPHETRITDHKVFRGGISTEAFVNAPPSPAPRSPTALAAMFSTTTTSTATAARNIAFAAPAASVKALSATATNDTRFASVPASTSNVHAFQPRVSSTLDALAPTAKGETLYDSGQLKNRTPSPFLRMSSTVEVEPAKFDLKTMALGFLKKPGAVLDATAIDVFTLGQNEGNKRNAGSAEVLAFNPPRPNVLRLESNAAETVPLMELRQAMGAPVRRLDPLTYGMGVGR